ncbi:MAG: YdiY family protein [Acidobacteriota bacterium]
MKRTIQVVLCAVAAWPLAADQITLKNGDRLTGLVVRSDDKELVFKSDYAGEVKVPMSAVTNITTGSTVYVGIKGGQVVSGSLDVSGEQVEVKSATANPVTSTRPNVEFIRSKDEQTAYDERLERYRNPRLIDLWSGFVDLGIAEARGNAITSNVTATADATRITTRDKIEVYFTSLYASSKIDGISAATANARRGGIRYDLNLTPKLFVFGQTDLEYDEFLGLDLRFSPAGGLGYHVIKNDRGFLDVLGGMALNREFFVDNTNRTSAEALLGQEGLYKLRDRMTFREKLTFYPNLTDRGDYRMNFDASLVTALSKWLGWQFTFSDRYLSNPVLGRKKNDQIFSMGLRLTFAGERGVSSGLPSAVAVGK